MQLAEVLKLHILSSRILTYLLTKAVEERPVFHFREAVPSAHWSKQNHVGSEYLRPALRLSSTRTVPLKGRHEGRSKSSSSH